MPRRDSSTGMLVSPAEAPGGHNTKNGCRFVFPGFLSFSRVPAPYGPPNVSGERYVKHISTFLERYSGPASACGNWCSLVTAKNVSKWHCGCYGIWNSSPLRDAGAEAKPKQGDLMREQSVRLGPREQQIVELLLQGCDNAEIARQLNMARRTVKAHFNRLFLRFGITGGIKRVKLATLLYRRQTCLPMNAMEIVSPVNGNNGSSSLSPKA